MICEEFGIRSVPKSKIWTYTAAESLKGKLENKTSEFLKFELFDRGQSGERQAAQSDQVIAAP